MSVSIVSSEHFSSSWFRERGEELGFKPGVVDRRVWGMVNTAEEFRRRCFKNATCLALGGETGQISHWLSLKGCSVLTSEDKVHRDSIQYSKLDMNSLPGYLHGKFDFLWSFESIGMLGNLDRIKEFFTAQLQYLCEGGVFAHTLRYVYNRDLSVVSTSECYLSYKFVQDVIYLLCEQGAVIEDIDFSVEEPKEMIYMPSSFNSSSLKLCVGEDRSGPIFVTSMYMSGTKT